MANTVHVFQGLKRDVHPINQKAEYLWDAHNVRLTSRTGTTTLSVTNEMSSKLLYTFDDDNYIGHTVIGDYLIVFTIDNTDDTVDRIYRFSKEFFESDEDVDPVILYQGDLNFSAEHPLQVISDYEAELVQKVYWTDGINRPRVINVAKPELLEVDVDEDGTYSSIYTDAPFDFVQDLALQEEVTITREANSSGLFAAGVIQYAMTYCYKYGQETNIFYTSELLYTSYVDRGADSESTVAVAFTITVDNIETRFDYLRIYSIQRTSLDGEAICKLVTDIDLKDNPTSITYTDTGTTGSSVDSSSLLYIGGKDITAQCIYNKDNVLFLGNITYNRSDIKELIDDTEEEVISLGCSSRTLTISKKAYDEDAFYNYVNQLCQNTSTFKGGEVYRLGLQFQYKTGEWSEPVWVKDLEMDWTQRPDLVFSEEEDNGAKLTLPIFTGQSESGFIELLYSAGYRKVRPLVVLPETYERDVIAQGVIAPTVFEGHNRDNNAPFVQSSWFFRLSGKAPTEQENTGLDGAVPEWRHYRNLTSGLSSGAEIQNLAYSEYELRENTFWMKVMGLDDDSKDITHSSKEDEICVDKFDLNTISGGITGSTTGYPELSCYPIHYVDQSIGTIHSPDIEFDDTTQLRIDNVEKWNFRIVGLVPFTYNYGDIDIQLSSVQANPSAAGVVCNRIKGNTGSSSLVSGLFFSDTLINDDDGDFEIVTDDTINEWMVFPWHTSGLNNDINRPDDKGTRTAVLSTKIISNIKYANTTHWLEIGNDNISAAFSYEDVQIKVFNQDEVSLIKLDDPNLVNGSLHYYGNIDTLIPSYTPYKLVMTGSNATSVASDSYASISDGTISIIIDGTTYSASITMLIIDVTSYTVTSSGVDTIEITGTISTNGIYEYSGLSESGDTVSLAGATVELTVTKYRDNDSVLGNLITGSSGTITTSDGTEYTLTIAKTMTSFNSNVTYDTVSESYIANADLRYLRHWPGTKEKEENRKIGDHYTGLGHPREGVRMKYKSTPHAVVALPYDEELTYRLSLPIYNGIGDTFSVRYDVTDIEINSQYWLNLETEDEDDLYVPECNFVADSNSFIGGLDYSPTSYLWLVEIYKKYESGTKFGGTTTEALRNNLWLPAGPAVSLPDSDNEDGNLTVTVEWWWGDTWYQRYDCLKTYPFADTDTNQIVEIGSFMCETRKNIDGRYDRNRGLVSNLNITNTNFNLINDVYSQKNNFFTYRIYDEDYYKVNNYPSQVMWSEVKSPASYPDEWTNLHMASTITLDASYGKVNAIASFNDVLLGFQDKATQNILFNSRVQLNPSDGVPIEIANNSTVEGSRFLSNTIGCQDKFSIVNTPMGIYFIDNLNEATYLFDGQLKNLSLSLGSLYWNRENHSDNTWVFTPYQDGNNGIRLYYDYKYQDVYFVPGLDNDCDLETAREALVYSEQLQHYTSFMNYGGAVMFPYDSKFYSIVMDGNLKIYENFSEDTITCNNILGIVRPYSITFVSNEAPTVTKIFDNVEMRTDSYEYDAEWKLLGENLTHTVQDGKPFNYIRAWNEYQDTGTVTLTDSTMRKKFRIWRAQVPRNKGTRQRIRNPWALITLGNDDPEYNALILHHLNVKITAS